MFVSHCTKKKYVCCVLLLVVQSLSFCFAAITVIIFVVLRSSPSLVRCSHSYHYLEPRYCASHSSSFCFDIDVIARLVVLYQHFFPFWFPCLVFFFSSVPIVIATFSVCFSSSFAINEILENSGLQFSPSGGIRSLPGNRSRREQGRQQTVFLESRDKHLYPCRWQRHRWKHRQR